MREMPETDGHDGLSVNGDMLCYYVSLALRGFTHRKFSVSPREPTESQAGREKDKQRDEWGENVRLAEDNRFRNHSVSSGICQPKAKCIRKVREQTQRKVKAGAQKNKCKLVWCWQGKKRNQNSSKTRNVTGRPR